MAANKKDDLNAEIDKAWDKYKDQILIRAREKFAEAINYTDDMVRLHFRSEVIRNVGTIYGGQNKWNTVMTVPEAVQKVLRSALFQTKERAYVFNSLSSFGNSQAYHKLVQFDNTVSIEDMVEKATYAKERSGKGAKFGLQDDIPTNEKGYIYTAPSGRRYFVLPPDSPTGRGWTWYLL